MRTDPQTPSCSESRPSTAVSRRRFLRSAGALGALAGAHALLPGWARASLPGGGDRHALPARAPGLEPTRRTRGRVEYDLTVAETPFTVDGERHTAITVNGTVPGPLIRLQEGEEVVLRYHNALDEATSIHWHGLLIPNQFDGVPGINFPGVAPGETFEAGPFEVRQYGTYWYHSHSGLQEQRGHYGPLVIDPAKPQPHLNYDREHVVVLSDFTFEDPHTVMSNLKKGEGYYDFQKRTVGDFWDDVREEGLWDTVKDRLGWKKMRMMPTDISDVTGATYTYLMNGKGPEQGWEARFEPGERVRLRFVNASAATIFDVRLPGLGMEVVQVSGQNVEPVYAEEFRMGPAERYDVIVEPSGDCAQTVFAEAIDRSGYARGTLAPQAGMTASVPSLRERPLLTMADMGMMHGGDMNHSTPQEGGMHGPMEELGDAPTGGAHDHGARRGSMNHSSMTAHSGDADEGGAAAKGSNALRAPGTLPAPVMHDREDDHGPSEAGLPMMTRSRLDEPGLGLGDDGRKVLTYAELRALDEKDAFAPPEREIELHLTGNMERFMWGINGVEYSEAEPIRATYGERLRLTIVNDTMMNHPMHLHGMFFELENGQGERSPLIDTITVKPAERVSGLITAIDPGPWFFHCHILYHMDSGMARVFHVAPEPDSGESFYYDPASERV